MDVKKVIAGYLFDRTILIWQLVFNCLIIGYYFYHVVANIPVDGAILWGYQVSVDALLMAMLSPCLGVLIDKTKSDFPCVVLAWS